MLLKLSLGVLLSLALASARYQAQQAYHQDYEPEVTVPSGYSYQGEAYDNLQSPAHHYEEKIPSHQTTGYNYDKDKSYGAPVDYDYGYESPSQYDYESYQAPEFVKTDYGKDQYKAYEYSGSGSNGYEVPEYNGQAYGYETPLYAKKSYGYDDEDYEGSHWYSSLPYDDETPEYSHITSFNYALPEYPEEPTHGYGSVPSYDYKKPFFGYNIPAYGSRSYGYKAPALYPSKKYIPEYALAPGYPAAYRPSEYNYDYKPEVYETYLTKGYDYDMDFEYDPYDYQPHEYKLNKPYYMSYHY